MWKTEDTCLFSSTCFEIFDVRNRCETPSFLRSSSTSGQSAEGGFVFLNCRLHHFHILFTSITRQAGTGGGYGRVRRWLVPRVVQQVRVLNRIPAHW
jgi:hypothetical protein